MNKTNSKEPQPVLPMLIQIIEINTPIPEGSTGIIKTNLRERIKIGKAEYGTELMTHNTRDAMLDAYEEMLDTCLYLTQAYMETSDPQVLDLLHSAIMLTEQAYQVNIDLKMK